jgi:rSAM/selenodomain-associated transferase 1
VKTRLSGAIGAETATRIYSICAKIAFRAIKGVTGNIVRYIFYTCETDHDIRDIRRLVGPTFYLVKQKGSNLGERLIHAFRTVFDYGADGVVVIATDVPDISSHIIKQAIDSLNDHDIVIGPAPDGGYYLLGMNRLYVELFHDIDWGSNRVLEETLAIIRSLGLSTFILPGLLDIDTKEDLYCWMEKENRNHHLYRFLRNELPKEKKYGTGTETNQPGPII